MCVPQYLFLFKPVQTKPPEVKGKLAAGIADVGMHRLLKGPARHPLHGHRCV